MKISIRLTRLLIAVVGASTSACDAGRQSGIADADWARVGRWCFLSSPATSLTAASLDSLPVDAYSNSADGRWARVARTVPGGWGGGWFVDKGVFTIYLTDPSRRADALAALNRLAVDGHRWGSDLQVRHGRWSFAQLYDWYRYLNLRIGMVDLSGSDIDEAQNRLVYSVTSDSAKRALETRLSALNVPCYLVAVEIRGFATPASAAPLPKPSVPLALFPSNPKPPFSVSSSL
jgi:hypothetical protein